MDVLSEERANLDWWLAHKSDFNAVPGQWYLVDHQQVIGGPEASKSALLMRMMKDGIRPSPSYCIFQCGREALPCHTAVVS